MMPFDKLGLGTVQFGINYGISNTSGQVNKYEIENILIYCKQNGIGVIDTASAYGNAEKMIGKFDLSGFKVVSKFLPNKHRKEFDLQLDNTLFHLNIDRLYGYLAHRPQCLINNPWEWEALQESKAKGKICKIGFSLNSPQELVHLLNQNFIPDLIQVPYNYLDRRFENLLKDLKKLNIEIHTRSVFLQGLFFMNPDTLSNHFSLAVPFLKSLANTPKLPGKLLEFALEKDFIDRVIVGTESLFQFKANISQILTSHVGELPSAPNLPESILMPMLWPISSKNGKNV